MSHSEKAHKRPQKPRHATNVNAETENIGIHLGWQAMRVPGRMSVGVGPAAGVRSPGCAPSCRCPRTVHGTHAPVRTEGSVLCNWCRSCAENCRSALGWMQAWPLGKLFGPAKAELLAGKCRGAPLEVARSWAAWSATRSPTAALRRPQTAPGVIARSCSIVLRTWSAGWGHGLATGTRGR